MYNIHHNVILYIAIRNAMSQAFQNKLSLICKAVVSRPKNRSLSLKTSGLGLDIGLEKLVSTTAKALQTMVFVSRPKNHCHCIETSSLGLSLEKFVLTTALLICSTFIRTINQLHSTLLFIFTASCNILFYSSYFLSTMEQKV